VAVAALRSEPGIPSARTLRGSEDASPSGRRREERGERAVGIEDKAGQGRGVDGVRALCGGGWPGLAQAADLAGSAARPNGGRRAPPPGLRGALPRPANAWQWRRAAPNRGYHLPARSAAPRAPPHPAGGGAALRSEPGIPSARTLRGSEDATPSGRRREQEEERERRAAGIERGTRQGGGEEREEGRGERSRGACGPTVTGVRSERGRREAIAER